MPLKVLIADDHDVIREGVKSILRGQPEYKVVGEAVNGEEVVHGVEKLKPDILLLDITMPKKGGLDVIEQVQRRLPNIKIVMVTVHRASIYISKALKLGVKGYLNKENVVEELLPALRKIAKGEVYMSPQVSEYMIEKVTHEGKEPQGELLTERESDILRLLVEGKTAKEIAGVLYISRRTVENYKNNLLKKLGLHKTSDLIKYAVKHKIIETEE